MKAITSNTQALASIPSCRLLALPRELRDMIYDCALTSKSGLAARMDGATLKVVEFFEHPVYHNAPEFNQLQYVSKQLREETRGLSMKNNTLFICGRMNENISDFLVQGNELVVHFVEECSPKVKAMIRDLRIWNFVCDAPRSLSIPTGITSLHPAVLSLYIHDDSPVSLFCQQYPRAQVSFRGPDFTEEWLMSFAVMYHYHTTF